MSMAIACISTAIAMFYRGRCHRSYRDGTYRDGIYRNNDCCRIYDAE